MIFTIASQRTDNVLSSQPNRVVIKMKSEDINSSNIKALYKMYSKENKFMFEPALEEFLY